MVSRAGMRPAFTAAIMLSLSFLLAACIVVEDFSDYWDKGYTDACVNDIILRDIGEDEAGRDMEFRSVLIGRHTFLMMREHEGDKGGNLLRYEVQGEDFIQYQLNDKKRGDFLRKYPDSTIVVTKETATIPVLDDEAAKLLAEIADDESYWLENKRVPYNPVGRAGCVQESAQ